MNQRPQELHLDVRAAREPRAVLALVVLAELARLDRLPPGAVVAVPVDRALHALVEADPRRPAEAAHARRVEGITPVVPGPVVDAPQQRPVGPGQLEDRLRDLDVLALVAAADVVGLARGALAKHELDPGAVILDEEPVADLP